MTIFEASFIAVEEQYLSCPFRSILTVSEQEIILVGECTGMAVFNLCAHHVDHISAYLAIPVHLESFVIC